MNRIKLLREKAGFTQCEFARKLKISQSTVAMWETNKSNPTANKLPIIAKLLNCSIDELYE